MENTEKKLETTNEEVVVKKLGVKAKNVVVKKPKGTVILRNTSGKEVPTSDYFYKNVVPSGFEATCGKPVDREDLLEVFDRVFKPSDNILFYRQIDKEVYLIIIPIKYSASVGEFNDSVEGDFQKHAISFLDEGSVILTLYGLSWREL